MPQGCSSGEWHTGEVVNLCEAYGFIRISKEAARDASLADEVKGAP